MSSVTASIKSGGTAISRNMQGPKAVKATTVTDIYNELKNPMNSYIKFNPNESLQKSKINGKVHRTSKTKLEAKAKFYQRKTSNEKRLVAQKKIRFKLRKNSFGNVKVTEPVWLTSKKAEESSSPKKSNLPSSLSSGISDIKKQYHPDFGYKELISYKPKSGWSFLGDIISKYPKQERMLNIIKFLNHHKEINIMSMQKLLSDSEFNMSDDDKERVIGEIYKLRDKRMQNDTKKQEPRSFAQRKVSNLKDDLDKIQKSFFDNFKSFEVIKNSVSFFI